MSTIPIVNTMKDLDANGIRAIQIFLKGLGADVVPDGNYGRSTRNSVMQFQSAHGLRQDGMAGGQSTRMLHSSEFESEDSIKLFFDQVMAILQATGGHYDDDVVKVIGSLIGANPTLLPDFLDNILIPTFDHLTMSVILQKVMENLENGRRYITSKRHQPNQQKRCSTGRCGIY